MIKYCVTVKISNKAHDEWFAWMKETHIPEVMHTGFFTEHNIFRIMSQDEDGENYSIQYTCDSMAKLQQYSAIAAPALQKEHTEKFKDEFVAFRTILTEV